MEHRPSPDAAETEALLSRCVSIDLETNPTTNKIMSFAALRPGQREPYVFQRGDVSVALKQMDDFAEGAEFIVGHNFIHFDAEHLKQNNRDLRILERSIIDTLWLNPLAFPRNPYHHLVKHYQDGRLQGGHINDPALDAELTLTVLRNQIDMLSRMARETPDALTAFHWLTTTKLGQEGFDAVFNVVRGKPRPDASDAHHAMRAILEGEACKHQVDWAIKVASYSGWSLAYALSWISVAGADSVMPSWVRHQFPQSGDIVRKLRDTPCTDSTCTWCRVHWDPVTLLKMWFGFESFRPIPADKDGMPLQQAIVATALAKTPVLGILPTGTGKSVCYQLPALAQYQKIGALTVVISPLVALMADQIESLKRQGISSCVTINGMLSLPERQEALDQVRLGDAAILLISPEQLRSPSIRSVLNQRQIGFWVLDEAHCVSKWGHDFRPDYRYVARFIKEYSGDERPSPLICLTATAKPSVITDIIDHFRTKLGETLQLIDGGAVRENLSFEVIPTTAVQKNGDIVDVLKATMPGDGVSGAIVYCSTRNAAENVAAFLEQNGFAAAHYHAGLKPETKLEVQRDFSSGKLRVIAATNAFGMGIDKPDIRLVVHGDIPGSLENYVQEAGRAGRDRDEARCVLLYSRDDIERQFRLTARSRLTKREIAAILKSLRRLDRRLKRNGEVVATPGEIVKEELDHEFQRDTATDDTRVKTAVSWLEESVLLRREENRVGVFPSSLKVRTIGEASELIKRAQIPDSYRKKLLTLVRNLMNAPSDQGISTDQLCGQSGFTPSGLRKAFSDLEGMGIASNDTAITVFVHVGVADSSEKRLLEAASLESDLIEKLRELAPDLELGETSTLNLKIATQELRDAGHMTIRPDILSRVMGGIARDGRDDSEGTGSVRLRKLDRDHLSIRLQRSWEALTRTANLRRKGASVILKSLLQSAEKGTRGKDIQVETTLGNLMSALRGDLELSQDAKDPSKLLDRALLWLHEQSVVTLGKGLTIFRPAMTIHLAPDNQKFTNAHFKPLEVHYDEQTLQTHIMAAYAEQGLDSVAQALQLTQDYFTLSQNDFVGKWLQGQETSIKRQTTPESYQVIVETLGNPNQSRIVADEREQTNVLVLAGPGSGKTRVLVHRIAYLIRVKREDPRGILALVYNRHAASEIRRRLFELIGDDARGVTISTCHGFAMRIVGASFAKRAENLDPDSFDKILKQAVSLLRGDGLSRDEAEAQRETLIEGYRWILVDEYQDIGLDEYELIAAVAGRSLGDEDSRLGLFAVGDDDQNIYAFAGASVEFIRRFSKDYNAQPVHLIENYRSTANIISAANRVIEAASNRMKAGHDIVVNRARKKDRQGGALERIDTIGRGRVQILNVANGEFEQAVIAVQELQRLSRLVPNWDWRKAAVIAREWRYLQPVRSYCEAKGIPVQVANADSPSIWRLRETQALVNWLKTRKSSIVHASDLASWIEGQTDGPWWSVLRDGVSEFVEELGERDTDHRDFLEWLAEWARDVRKRQNGLMLLSAHRAKGLEFDDVVILDGGWERKSSNEDADAARRLYYVAMTRARRSLSLISMSKQHPFVEGLADPSLLTRTTTCDTSESSHCAKVYQTLDPSEVDLSYAGRLAGQNTSLAALERLSAGDPIQLRQTGGQWYILDEDGVRVGRLAKKFTPPDAAVFVRGTVFAITTRFRSDSSSEYHDQLKRGQWFVVLPELVFRKSVD